MRVISIFFIFLLFVGFVNPHSLGRFLIEEPFRRGDVGTAYLTVRNNFDTKLEDVNVKFYIYDLGLMYSSVPFDISKRDHVAQKLFMDIPKDIPEGDYLTRITVGNDKFKDTQYIYLRIV